MKKALLISLLYTITVAFAASTTLQVEPQTITVNGHKVPYYSITQPDGTWGFVGHKGDTFNVVVKNKLNEPTAIHWHGLELPNSQDGVDYVTQDPIPAHGQMEYKFVLNHAGTFWMHSHFGLQEQIGIEAPLLVLDNYDNKYQQIPIMFQDFTYKKPEDVMKKLTGGDMSDMHMGHDDMDMSNMDMSHDMDDMKNMNHDNKSEHDSHGVMDLNDVKYDAYLTNYHSPDNPQITQVKAGSTVRLRFIDGAAASNFWINLGKLQGKIIAVDAKSVTPYLSNRFQIAMGQRVDVLVNIPQKGGTFPIIGQVEGLKSQTGIILTTNPKLKSSLPSTAKSVAGALDYNQEYKLHSSDQQKPHAKNITMVLNGDMKTYKWTLNGERWPKVTPLKFKLGEVINLTFDNKSMMAHPMHLHGHSFKIIAINGRPINGATRDTVLVLPNSKVTVQFTADHIGKWMLHCHTAYHMAGGMMTYIVIEK